MDMLKKIAEKVVWGFANLVMASMVGVLITGISVGVCHAFGWEVPQVFGWLL